MQQVPVINQLINQSTNIKQVLRTSNDLLMRIILSDTDDVTS